MKNRPEIQPDSFEKLLKWLDRDRDASAVKYEAIRTRLIKILNYRGCFEAEDLADTAIDRVIGKIDFLAETYEGDPVYYFLGVANNVYREFLKKPRMEELPADVAVREPGRDEEAEAEHGCLDKCLGKLPADHRQTIIEYYKEDKSAKIDHRKQLAEKSGITMGALHVKVFRLRAGLQKCVVKCVEGNMG